MGLRPDVEPGNAAIVQTREGERPRTPTDIENANGLAPSGRRAKGDGASAPDAARATGNWTSGSSPLWIDRFAENEAVATEGDGSPNSNSLREAGRRAAGPQGSSGEIASPLGQGHAKFVTGSIVRPSMGSVGDAYDNAIAESFFDSSSAN